MIQKRQRRRRGGGTYNVWRVRWYGADGRELSKTFDLKKDAKAFEAKVRLLKRSGRLADIDAGKETLAAFVEEWWSGYAEPNLEVATLKSYATLWNAHALPRLGDVRLREVTPRMLSEFRRELEKEGVGPASVRRMLVIIQSILQRAVEWERIASNPAKVVRKPVAKRVHAIQPLPPAKVEEVRQYMLGEDWRSAATLVSLLAYAGLRPQEALALTWASIRQRTILVEGAVSFGAIKGQKNSRPPRTIPMLRALVQDLAEFRLIQGRPDRSELIFPGRDGDAWKDHDWRNWRSRRFKPTAVACGLEGSRPYDLRHSYASLMIHEGRSVVEVAAELGHSPAMTLNTYGHVIAELAEGDRVSAEQAVKAARESRAPAQQRRRAGQE